MGKRIKLTILTQEYPPYCYGGAGILVSGLSKGLSNLMDVDVRYFGTESLTVSPTLTVTGYHNAKLDCHFPSNKILNVLSTSLLMMEQKKTDIIQTFPWHTSFAAVLMKQLYNVPLIFTPTSLEKFRPWKREVLGNAYKISCYLETYCIENADFLIAISEEMKNNLINEYNILSDKICVIPSGVDTNVFKKVLPGNTLKKYGIVKDYVLFVGRKSKQKGIEYLLQALEFVKSNVQFVLCLGKADSPEYDNELAKKISKFNRRGNILVIDGTPTFYNREEIVEMYSNARMLIVPSIYEPFGIVNIEAMACETPVLANNIGGMRDIILDGKNGFLVNAQKAEELAYKIDTLLLSPLEYLKNIGSAARKSVVEQFSWEEIAKRYYGIYKRALND